MLFIADDRQSFLRYPDSMAQNPVKAGLADSPERFSLLLHLLGKTKGSRGYKAR